MAGEWVKKKIGALGRVVTGKTPPTSNPANFGGPYPFITIPDLDGRVAIDRTERTLSQQGADILKSCLLPPGSVIMSCIATVGRCGITTKPSFTNQQINSVILTESTDARFLYYVFTQLGHELESAGGGGSVYTNVSKSRFADIEVMLPKDVGEQRAIAHILGTLDDRIELNRRLSQTLEAMARALFKSWFVDFDPVRAKMEGRWQRGQSLPGLPAHLYDLFPDRLVDSELGEVPEGWEVVRLGELIETVKGRSYKSEELVEGSEVALVTLKSFARGGGYRPDGLKPFAGPYKQEQIVKPGEVVVACTDVTQAAEVIGRAAMVRRSNLYRELVASLDTLIVRPKTSDMTVAFLYSLLRTDAFVEHTYAHVTGTTVLHLAKEAVPSFTFALPPGTLVHIFDGIAGIIFSKVETLELENDTLAALRDALLPKLISGEIRVKDAERFLERARP
jgi:type I restriction enzyme S subunit